MFAQNYHNLRPKRQRSVTDSDKDPLRPIQ